MGRIYISLPPPTEIGLKDKNIIILEVRAGAEKYLSLSTSFSGLFEASYVPCLNSLNMPYKKQECLGNKTRLPFTVFPVGVVRACANLMF